MFRRHNALLMMVLAAATPSAAKVFADEDSVATRKVSISHVMRSLRREAANAWRTRDGLTPEQPDYALRTRTRVAHDKIVSAVCRPASTHPAIDAFIRRQLLSFNPDFTLAAVEDLRRLVETLPPLRDANGRLAGAAASDPTLSVIQIGAVLDATGHVSADRRYVTLTTRASAADLVRIRRVRIAANRRRQQQVAAASNEAVIAFRNDLIARLPQHSTIAALATLQDLTDRMAVSHASAGARFERFVALIDRISDDPRFDETAHTTLRTRLIDLANRAAPRAAPLDGHTLEAAAAGQETDTLTYADIESAIDRLSRHPMNGMSMREDAAGSRRVARVSD